MSLRRHGSFFPFFVPLFKHKYGGVTFWQLEKEGGVDVGRLTDKVALVTGASRGIGRAIAQRFAEEGAKVVVNYSRSKSEGEKVAQSIEGRGGKALAIGADVSSKKQVHAMIDQIVKVWGGIDILVNNAGVARDRSIEEMTESEWDEVIDVNLKGTFLCSQAVLPLMKAKGWGKVITVSAATALKGRTNGANFCAAKAGIIALTKCLALEGAPEVQANCLMPGFTETEDVIQRFGLDDPNTREALERSIPLGRLATPEEIAAAAVILAAKESDLMTGQTLLINGGSYMAPA